MKASGKIANEASVAFSGSRYGKNTLGNTITDAIA